MKPIIKIENLNFIYNKGKDNEFHALININLEIYPEEFIIFFGPSGCGKSTLLNVIAGLETPQDGKVFVYEKDLSKMTRNEFALYHRECIGMIFQAYNLITSLTVLDNVALPQMFVNARKGKRNPWSRSLLERFGILKHAKKIPTELSGGQQQRIGIARAIVNNPKIVLADEPVGNLDSVSAKNVLGILSDLNQKEKKTVIMVTHNPENLVFADRIFYLKDGMVTREVVNKEKYNKDKDRKDKLSESPTEEIKNLIRAYQRLSPEQINILIMPYKSKIFAHHFVANRSLEETKIFEDILQKRLTGAISQEELFEVLNRPFNDGGVGYDKRTAQKIIQKINEVLKMAYLVSQERRQRKNNDGKHDKITDDEKADIVIKYLMENYCTNHGFSLSEEEAARLKVVVRSHIAGEIRKTGFYKALDTPFKDGGVGLNSKTAEYMAEEMELILILSYGISQSFTAKKINQGEEEGRDKTTKKEGKKSSFSEEDFVPEGLEREKKNEETKNIEPPKIEPPKDKETVSIDIPGEISGIAGPAGKEKNIEELYSLVKNYTKGSLERKAVEEEIERDKNRNGNNKN